MKENSEKQLNTINNANADQAFYGENGINDNNNTASLAPPPLSYESGPIQMKNGEGPEVHKQLNEPESVTLEIPGYHHMLSPQQSQALIVSIGLRNTALAGLMASYLLYSTVSDVTIGLGGQAGSAFLVGGSLGAGYVINNGRIGYYGNLSEDRGVVIGASAEVVVTIVNGGLDNFGGDCDMITAGGGEGVVGHFSLLFNQEGDYIGMAGSIGVGAGLTVLEGYSSSSYTVVPDH